MVSVVEGAVVSVVGRAVVSVVGGAVVSVVVAVGGAVVSVVGGGLNGKNYKIECLSTLNFYFTIDIIMYLCPCCKCIVPCFVSFQEASEFLQHCSFPFP